MGDRVSLFRRCKGAFHVPSILLGAVLSLSVTGLFGTAVAFDLGGVTNSVKNLVNIKKNLDSDIKLLTGDAKTLIADKEKLMAIKDALLKLAKDTKTQIDSITVLVGEVEGHIKKTQTDIQTTADHVSEIDKVRKALQGK